MATADSLRRRVSGLSQSRMMQAERTHWSWNGTTSPITTLSGITWDWSRTSPNWPHWNNITSLADRAPSGADQAQDYVDAMRAALDPFVLKAAWSAASPPLFAALTKSIVLLTITGTGAGGPETGRCWWAAVSVCGLADPLRCRVLQHFKIAGFQPANEFLMLVAHHENLGLLPASCSIQGS